MHRSVCEICKTSWYIRSVESIRPRSSKHLLAVLGRSAMRKRELQILGRQLLDVWSPNIFRLFDFDHLENLVERSTWLAVILTELEAVSDSREWS